MSNLTMGSLFDGSGGFPLGAMLEGVTPVWASEIEPFPICVTTKRLPEMKHYGDICQMNGGNIEPVDIVTFGSPCTNMSVAGKREGLSGKQSSLFYEAIRIIREMRCATNGKYPRFIVFENVPGMFSSGQGSDFREVLSEIVKVKSEALSVPMPETGKWLPSGEIVGDGFSVAYRTIDAQFWGTAQRRRRCYLVADFTDECAGRILSEFESLSGYTPQSFGAGQGTARHAEAGTGASGRIVLNDQGGSCMDVSEDVTGTLRAEEHGHQPIVFEPGAASRLGGHAWDDSTGSLRADMGDNQLCAAIPINTQIATRHEALGEGTGFGVGKDGDPAFTLQAAHSHAVAVENHPADSRIQLDESGTIQTLTGRMGTGGGNVPLVASFMGGQGSDAGSIAYSETVTPTLRGQAGGNSVPMVMNERQYALTVGEDVANTLSATDYKGTQCVFEPAPQTLKIRSGCEGGGKGALIQEDKSATLSCNNDQTVFVPFRKGTRPHNKDEGQKWESAETANTLNTFDVGESRCNELAVKASAAPVAYGICSDASNAMRSGNPDSGIYEADTSRTLDGNGGNPACNQGGIAVVSIEGNGVRPSHKGSGIGEDISFTLNTIERHAVCYQDVVGSLCASDYKFPQQQQIEESKAVVEQVIYENYQHSGYREVDTAGTLKASGGDFPGGENVSLENSYIVRRLTPTECALLQGFPPDWCTGLETPEPTEDEIAWWADVFETYRKVTGTSSKQKSRNQIVKWLRHPHTDSAEYKMWGNGVALPCVRFVMAGIVWAAEGSL